jgi:hypothetical protein
MTILVDVVVVLIVACVGAMFVVMRWAALTPIGQDDRLIFVTVGDIWRFVGYTSAKAGSVKGEVYAVERANVNTEAGLDSWIMHPVDPSTFESLGVTRRAYMHHRTRAADWKLLRRCGVLTRDGEQWLRQ